MKYIFITTNVGLYLTCQQIRGDPSLLQKTYRERLKKDNSESSQKITKPNAGSHQNRDSLRNRDRKIKMKLFKPLIKFTKKTKPGLQNNRSEI